MLDSVKLLSSLMISGTLPKMTLCKKFPIIPSNKVRRFYVGWIIKVE